MDGNSPGSALNPDGAVSVLGVGIILPDMEAHVIDIVSCPGVETGADINRQRDTATGGRTCPPSAHVAVEIYGDAYILTAVECHVAAIIVFVPADAERGVYFV